jgi:chromosome segregation ATPase
MVGEPKMEILETNVKHNTEDIRELKKRVDTHEASISDLKIDSHSTKQNFGHVFNTLNKFESTLEKLDEKFDEDKKERHLNQIDQLKQYKSAVWQVGIYLSCVIIAGFLLMEFGLK